MAQPKPPALPTTDISSDIALTDRETRQLRDLQKASSNPIVGGLYEGQYNRLTADIMARHQQTIIQSNIDRLIGEDATFGSPETYGGEFGQYLNELQGTQNQMGSLTGSTGGEGSSAGQVIADTTEQAQVDIGKVLEQYSLQAQEVENWRTMRNIESLGQTLAGVNETLANIVDIGLMVNGLPPMAGKAVGRKTSNRGRTLSGGLLGGRPGFVPQ